MRLKHKCTATRAALNPLLLQNQIKYIEGPSDLSQKLDVIGHDTVVKRMHISENREEN